jgi:hypothetical protein
MGDFSIPAIMPSQVLSGAISRWREHQEADLAEHRARRDAYIAHLGQLMNVARDGDTINWLSNEIVRAEETPDEKLAQFKGKPLPVPMSMQPPGTPAPGASKSTAGGGSGGDAATPPTFDFSHVMQAITGQSAAPDDGSGDGSVADQVPVTPPPLSGSPFTSATPQLTPTSPAAPFTSATPSLVPSSGLSSGLPSVAMTPPGHSVPEPSPLVGTLPGTPSPGLGGVGGGIGPSGGQPPMTPPSMPASVTSAAPAASASAATPPSFQPQFMGFADKAALAAQLKSGGVDKSEPTAKEKLAGMSAGLQWNDTTDSWEPITDPHHLALIQQGKLRAQEAALAHQHARDDSIVKLQDAQAALARAKAKGNPGAIRMAEETLRLRLRNADMRQQSLNMRARDQAVMNGDIDPEHAPAGMLMMRGEDGLLHAVGTRFASNVRMPAAIRTKAAAAENSIVHGQGMVDFAMNPENADLFGKLQGRWDKFLAGKLGADDPRSAKLLSDTSSMAALLPAIHGFRSMSAAEEFLKTLNRADSPEAFAAAVQSYMDMARIVHDRGENPVSDGKGGLRFSDGSKFVQSADGTGAPEYVPASHVGMTPTPVNTKSGSGTSVSTTPAGGTPAGGVPALTNFHTNPTTHQRIGQDANGRWVDAVTGKLVK